jgi:hypothetical protein
VEVERRTWGKGSCATLDATLDRARNMTKVEERDESWGEGEWGLWQEERGGERGGGGEGCWEGGRGRGGSRTGV